jgi:acyl-CoA dehydrogenase
MRPSVFASEHDALRAEARRWAAHRLAADPEQIDLGDLAAEAGSLGYLGAGYPEDAGGSGGDLLAAVVVAEELGAARAGGLTAALLAQAHAGPPLLLVAGEAPDLVAQALGGGAPVAVIDGAGAGVLNAHRAAAVLVVEADRVRLATAGWRVRPPAARLGWDGADLGDVDLSAADTTTLADGAHAHELASHQRRRGWLVSAAAAVAGAWRTFVEARDYAAQREAFGRPIGRFQVNRHGLAEAATRLTAARALVHDVAWQATHGAGPADAGAAWWYAARTAAATSDLGLQLHGGYGYTMEYPVQRAWRDDRMAGWGPGGLERAREHVLEGLSL